MPNYSRDMTSIDCELKNETDDAYLVVLSDEREVWIPKSISEWNPSLDKVNGTIEVPMWFAIKESLEG